MPIVLKVCCCSFAEQQNEAVQRLIMTDIENEEDVIGVGSELQYFAEKDLCLNLLVQLCGPMTPAEFRPKYEEYNKVLLKYLEQPLLLNPHIVDLVAPMSSALMLVTSHRPGKQVCPKVFDRQTCTM